MTDTEAIIVQEIDRRRAAESKADELVAAIRALRDEWRDLSTERVYPYGKLMKPWAQDAFRECAEALARLLGEEKAP